MSLDKKEALSRLQNICSRQEKCVFDVRSKLVQWSIPSEDQDEIIGMLIDEKYIDENRYANSFVRDKYNISHWGRYKISYALKSKKIPGPIIEDALGEIDENNYLQILRDILTQKNRTIKYQSRYEQVGKLKRFALGRGYLNDEIDAVVNGIINE